MANRKLLQTLLVVVGIVAFSPPLDLLAQKVQSVPKWQPFELTLKSSRNYTNPLQEAEVRALFISPLGETNRVYGFWDGGRTWRVRYQPAFPGRWTYYTMCSDTSNSGLHEQTGEFLCTASRTDSSFAEHGPVQVARDNWHFEHADRTPFLWLGDAAWDTAARSTASDWSEYTKMRAAQKFNVVQWKLPAATFTSHNRISINLDAFKQLETRIESANRAGLLNAIAPLWEIGAAGDILPENQAIALLRYCVARWDADDVAWIVAFESDSTGAQAARWQRIGRAVFNSVSHAPVVLLPGDSSWVTDNFRHERWVDALGIQTAQVKDEDSLPWLLNGPVSLERNKSPVKPLITLAPPAETANSALAATDLARRLLWWNVLLNTPAGVSCSARDVADWTTDGKTPMTSQPWYQALFLPGAAAIAPLNDFLATKDFWRLQPLTQAVTAQTTAKFSRSQIVAVGTEDHSLTVVYIPEDRAVNLAAHALPARPNATWFNPRTGESRKTGAVSGPTNANYATPAPGDWVLVLQARK